MKLKNRFLLVGLGIIVFLILTPLLVLFARGFKLDLKNWQIVKTGILVVNTEPQKAKVFLDDEQIKDLTPSTVRFLLPGDYNIRVEKDGYLPWTKRLSVKSQFVTWANLNREFIPLFLAEPKQEFDPQIPDEQIELVGEGPIQAGIYLFMLKDSVLFKQNEALEKIYEPVTQAYWDKSADRLVLLNNNEVLVFDPLSSGPDLILRSISEIKSAWLNWHTGYVFFQNEGKIKAIELDGRDHRNVYTLTDALDEFLVSKEGKKLYVFNGQEIKTHRIR
ncbi:MAG: PEGA domain-containing protein [Candidatus Doudnabacteria bacterium]|nr:PEGA domain-containing protein [Candidatus Doudnabacteria bacterium]